MATTRKHIVTLAHVGVGLALISGATIAAPIDIVQGSDYFHTNGAGLSGVGLLESRPGGLDNIRPQYALPSSVDTIIERQGNCNIDLGESCTIAIELVGLSLKSGSFWVREDQNRDSSGTMTINYSSLDSGIASGTFDSLFTVYFEYSVDGGMNWFDMEDPIPNGYPGVQPYQLGSGGTTWSSDPLDDLLLTGLVGDQAANWHTDKDIDQYDFFSGAIHEANPVGSFHDVAPVPIPPTVLLFGLSIPVILILGKKRQAHT